MKNILLFGAGKSATVLIDYLKQLADNNNYNVTVADGSFQNAASKIGKHNNVKPVELNIENETARKSLIENADIVISLMPPHLHYLIALDCIAFSKNLLTASYIDKQTQELANQAKEKGILFLYEMGLDPGIDHLSAMQIIHRIQKSGGNITSFISHCGGLVAPESDDNPWHYKISWNPRNVVMAGKAGATFLQDGSTKNIGYEHLFNHDNIVALPNAETLAYYPNRDSLGYIETYGLKGIKTFIRTTLRHPEFCFGWKNIIDLKLTNEDKVYETTAMTIAQFFTLHFERNGFNNWLDEMMMTRLNKAKETMETLMQIMEAEEVAIEKGEVPDETIMIVDEAGTLNTIDIDDVKENAAEMVAAEMNEANLSMKQLIFLGLDDNETQINLGLCSAADVLQFILEKKLVLSNDDKDMIVMLHEFEYELNGKKHSLKSLLRVIGENNTHTAMAKTVGLPLGIAAQLILEGKIKETGLHIPILQSIYEPVLKALEQHHIIFEETETSLMQTM
jgi:saccharopine dehydrogenase-like NADP-dependent oxidoreductase